MTTAQRVLDVARRNLGITEIPMGSNQQPYAAIAGHAPGKPWCASFVVACARAAKVKLGNESAWTPSLAASMTPVAAKDVQPGDLMFMFFPTLGRIAHVGLVEHVGSTFVLTIEGNTDVAGGRTGGKVMRKKRAMKYLTFARPAYRPLPTTVAKPKRKPDPILRIGNRGQLVLNIQRALVKHGGRCVLDGDFGPATKRAVMAFQKRKGLVVDGIVGQATWTALRQAPARAA